MTTRRHRRLYLAGPMRGLPDDNVPAFRYWTVKLQEQGFHVVSPVEVGEEWDREEPDHEKGAAAYVRKDLEALLTCGSIALLPGWENSTGARCEVGVAITLGLDFYTHEGRWRPTPERVVIAGGYERPPGPTT